MALRPRFTAGVPFDACRETETTQGTEENKVYRNSTPCDMTYSRTLNACKRKRAPSREGALGHQGSRPDYGRSIAITGEVHVSQCAGFAGLPFAFRALISTMYSPSATGFVRSLV